MKEYRQVKKNIPKNNKLFLGIICTQAGLTPFSCFSLKRRFENQKPTKTKKQALCFSLLFDLFVLEVGIEPTLPKELDFESSASTSSATEAFKIHLGRAQK